MNTTEIKVGKLYRFVSRPAPNTMAGYDIGETVQVLGVEDPEEVFNPIRVAYPGRQDEQISGRGWCKPENLGEITE